MTISPAAPVSDPAAGMVDADTFRQALARHAAGVVIVAPGLGPGEPALVV